MCIRDRCRARRHLGIPAVGRIELAPQTPQLLHVVCVFERLAHEGPQQALRDERRKRLVLGQQPRRGQGFQRLPGHARGLQLQAQGLGAARHARGQRGQHLQRACCITVFQCPLGTQQAGCVVHTVFATMALQGRLQDLVAALAVLQAVQAAGRQQASQRAEFDIAAQFRRIPLDGQRTLRGLVRTAVAGTEVLGQSLSQCSLGRTLALQCPPLARALGQCEQRMHRCV